MWLVHCNGLDSQTEQLGPAALLCHQLCIEVSAEFSESMCNVAPVIVRNIAVEWVALLFSIREVLGSNLRPETDIPGRYFMAFLSPSTQMSGYYHNVGTTASVRIPFQFIY
jgi:hypothetical protein